MSPTPVLHAHFQERVGEHSDYYTIVSQLLKLSMTSLKCLCSEISFGVDFWLLCLLSINWVVSVSSSVFWTTCFHRKQFTKSSAISNHSLGQDSMSESSTGPTPQSPHQPERYAWLLSFKAPNFQYLKPFREKRFQVMYLTPGPASVPTAVLARPLTYL